MSQTPVLPAGRAAVFTALCVGLAVAAHAWMSGAPVPGWAVAAGLFGVFTLARAAAGRERSLGAITSLMGLSQLGLHLLFEAAQQHAAAAAGVVTPPSAVIVLLPSVPVSGMGTAGATGGAMSTPGMAGMSMPGMPGMGGGAEGAPMRMTPGMIALHALAALICAWWLRRGEAAVHRLVNDARARLTARLAFPVLEPCAPPAADQTADRPGRPRPHRPSVSFLRHAVARRGPPTSAPACVF